MNNSVQTKIEKLQKDYAVKMEQIQKDQQWHLIETLSQELAQAIEAVTSEYIKEIEGQSSAPMATESTHYRQQECDINLSSFVYDGDRDYFEGFLKNPLIYQLVEEDSKTPSNSRKELLKHAMRLSPGMAPKVFNCIERCREKLGLKSKIDIYVSQNPSMNAYCYPSHEGCIYILVTSALLEKMNEDELTFVIGHEIGHFLYQHQKLCPQYIQKKLGAHLTPLDSIKLFSWNRNAELSADRIGLICCGNFEAASMANFKISSGISSDALLFSLSEYLKQYEDIEKEMNNSTASLEDFYSTHPLNPMRVIALELFHKSETYKHIFDSEQSAELSESEMEQKIKRFMMLMEPQYLNSDDDISKKIKEFIFLSGLTVASSDGTISKEELIQLGTLLPGENHDSLFNLVKNWTLEMKMMALKEQSEKITPHLSAVTSCNIIRDLTLVSFADGEFQENEYHCLCEICLMLQIHPSFIDQILNSISSQEAA